MQTKKVFGSLIGSLLVLISVTAYFDNGNLLTYRTVFNFAIFAGVTILFYYAPINPHSVSVYTFGFFLACSLVLGKAISNTSDIRSLVSDGKTICISAISIIGFTLLFGVLFKYLVCFLFSDKTAETKQWRLFASGKRFIILWFLIFICWIPCFLALYPGIHDYDYIFQTYEAVRGISAFTKYHPPLHTLIWAMCLMFGKKTGIEALAVYSVITMAFLSFVCSKLVCYLAERKVRNGIVLFALLFFSMNMVFSIFSLEMTKDVYFAGMLILAIIMLSRMVYSPDGFFKHKKLIIEYIVSVVLTCLFRNNAIYAFALSIPFIIVFIKKCRVKNLVLMMVPLIIFGVINGPVYKMAGISEGRVGEELNVPVQQIAKTVIEEKENLTDEEIREIEQYFDYDAIGEAYNPRFADPIKNTFKRENFKEDRKRFLKLWVQLFRKYPVDYINAFLDLNLPYWYIDAATIDEYAQRDYIEIEVHQTEDYAVERRSIIPELYDFYSKVADYSLFQKIPLVSLVFSISFPLWGMMLCFFILINQKKNQLAAVLMPEFFIWLTYMAGPVSNFRYIFPLFALYPLWTALAAEPGRFLE